MNNELLEIYKIYIEQNEKIASRRGNTNNFYFTLNTGIITISGFMINIENSKFNLDINVWVIILIFGLILNIIWYLNILSYKQISKLKFKVIKDIEKKLEYAPYTEEWNILENSKMKYIRQTLIERIIPLVFFSFFSILIILYLIKF